MDPVEIRSDVGAKQPIHFGDEGRPLFGFYHPPREGHERGVGVLLCRPIGTDLTRSERPYRHLAERLAAAGFACLRFDLSGTGDSGGDDADPRLVRWWMEDVGRAIEDLKARSGAERISLVGLRFGGLLAASCAASRGDIDSLVLWSPWVSGPAFVSESIRLHQLYLKIESDLAQAPPMKADGQEALGLFLPRAAIDDLAQLDLLQLARPPARRTLFIDGGNVAARDAMLARLKDLGAAPELRVHLGHKFLISVAHRAVVPDEILLSIVDWLGSVYPGKVAASAPKATPAIAGPAGEVPVRFGERRPLFGILSRPDPAKADRARPPILITNAGSVNRVGPHRLYVKLARRWAGLGFPVLRIDLSGIGDSPAAPGTRENLTYPPSGLADIAEALQVFGGRKAVIAGLCSGADFAFQLASRGEGMAGAIMINPRTFCVLDLAAVESADSAPSAAPVEDVPRLLRRSAESGVDTLLLVGRKDPGVLYVDAHVPDAMKALAAVSGFRRVDVAHTDHTFTPVSVQEQVFDLLSDHLLARY
ncbi:MAG TPA: alpha/beta hydrolase [Myxococcales bacterium]|nr:alpha/beta hydrolase [Myxococcales bacterium]